MRYSHIITGLSLCVALLTGCASQDKPAIPDKPAAQLYTEAQNALSVDDYQRAEKYLEALDNRYPFGPYADQVQLQLIHVYYKRNENEKALANIDRFIRNNPTSKALDYVYYMRGLTNMAYDYNFVQSLVGIDRASRDPSYSKAAFKDFKIILAHYPQSPYAADARKRMIFLRDKLARHEIDIAHYYMKREAYLAAVNRAKDILQTYEGSTQTRAALKVMIEGYTKLELPQLAKRSQQVLDAQSKSS
ncbi:outer membrane protein assembly factor BamD [Celerinatantimonas yamalensis]|uniref:Outer membrane protein assembly factor BamD n=1 Tax=Celerinatantimonas yamalensis TaxID=559956 RepID=A0ABW9GD10_9GAMM